ncbi:GNAT family N-acetyltransferase [Methanolobus sp. ZRKC3]|uniref:GNAT family N-acetyltransferase n=1 Tax=Methanolobus sp. ZRKC3 TaxID=3125786 RepID=UPI0032451912
MIIRPFSRADSSQVRSMVLEVLEGEGFHYDPVKDSDLEDIEGFYIENGGAFFVAVEGNTVVGSSALRRIGADICEIKRIYVRKDHRCKGIGSALLAKALDIAKQHCLLVTLKTDVSLENAISLYLKNGFIIVKEENNTVYFEKQLC